MSTLSAVVHINGTAYTNNTDKVLCIDESGSSSVSAKSFDFSDDHLVNMLAGRDNGYAEIVISRNTVFFTVDRIRTYPLFYAQEGSMLYISDDASWIKGHLVHPRLDEQAVVEFSQSGFVTGGRTLYGSIATLQAGEYARAVAEEGAWSIYKKRYFVYIGQEDGSTSDDELLEELDEIFKRVFTALLEKHSDKTPVVPLSGGIDSRLIVSWLKRLGCTDVLCYSFGTPANRDCHKAREIALRLNYNWQFINLTRDLWKEAYQSRQYHQLKKKFSGYCSLLSSQEFPAFYYLVQHDLLPHNAVFVPGHTGDFISGGHIPRTIFDDGPGLDEAVSYILDKHFGLWKTIHSERRIKDRHYLLHQVKDCLQDMTITSHDMVARAIEFFDWQERQAKFIVQFVTVYRLFGFPFALPLWSTRVMDFFLKLPLDIKLGKKLYRSYVHKYDMFGIFQDQHAFDMQARQHENGIYKSFLRRLKHTFYSGRLQKRWLAYFTNNLNYYAPFSYLRFVLSRGQYRNPNAFFAQDYLREIKSDLM